MGTRNTNVDRVDLEDILPDLHAIASEADPARRDRKLRALCDSGVDMAERLSDPELVAHASRNSDIDLRSILPDLKALAHEARATRRDEGAVVPAVRERPLPKTPWQRRRLVALAVLAVFGPLALMYALLVRPSQHGPGDERTPEPRATTTAVAPAMTTAPGAEDAGAAVSKPSAWSPRR